MTCFARTTAGRILRAVLVVALVAGLPSALALVDAAPPAHAQLFNFQDPFGNPFRQRQQQYQQQQQQYQQQQQQYWNPFQPQVERPAPPPDFSRAPAPPKKADGTVQTNVLVFGDSMSDWLAYGLELSFAESPEMGVVRKHKTWSGLIRQEVRSDPNGEHPDWPKQIQEVLATQRPDFIVMMIGLHDRRPIREIRPARAAVIRPTQQPGQPVSPATPVAPPGTPGAAPPPAAQDAPKAVGIPDPATPDADGPAQATSGVHEFRSERWSELYIRRIDETIAALKSKGIPVFWVGVPPVRGARSTADFSYLNDLFRSRAEKAGIVYVDVWDGFADDSGRFTVQGPDVDGQIRRLRAGDGVHFTQYGARKLAHFVERELQRWMTARATLVSLPPVDEPVKAPEPAKPGAAAPAATPPGPSGTARPLSGPVMPLSAVPIAGDGDEQLIGGGRPTAAQTNAQLAALDPVTAKVIVKGEPIPAPAGRADDFAWPRRDPAPVGADPVVAFASLPMTPMKSERQAIAEAPSAQGAAAGAAGLKPPAAPGPRVVARVAPRQQVYYNWFGQPVAVPQNQPQQYQSYNPRGMATAQRPTFFPFLFGGR